MMDNAFAAGIDRKLQSSPNQFTPVTLSANIPTKIPLLSLLRQFITFHDFMYGDLHLLHHPFWGRGVMQIDDHITDGVGGLITV